MLKDALQECYSIAEAQGIDLPKDSINDILAAIDRYPPQNIPSLQRDIQSGRPSELETQIGVVVRLGKTHNIPTPVYKFIYYSLLPQEEIARGKTNR
jgi:2-dehydropantoate 2-reductase